jgi:hypothetical protein
VPEVHFSRSGFCPFGITDEGIGLQRGKGKDSIGILWVWKGIFEILKMRWMSGSDFRGGISCCWAHEGGL